MPTATIQVAAVTSPDQWLLVAGADKVAAVNSPDDSDTSCLNTSTGGTYGQQYSLAANSIPSGSTINSVSIYSRARVEASSANMSVRLSLGANDGPSFTRNYTTSYASYTDASTRPGGGTWTKTDIDNLEVEVYASVGSIRRRITSLWVIVDYTPPKAAMFLLFP